MMRNIQRLGFLLCILGIARVAAADPREQARGEYARGKALYDQGNFAAARLAFESAQRLAPSPVLYYNIGLCHEGLGEWQEAIDDYRRYLAEAPNAPNRSQVEERIAALEAKLPGAAAPATGYEPTGNPELDRVAKIPIPGAVSSPPAAGAPEQPLPDSVPDGAGPVPPRPAVPDPPPQKSSGPFYTKWWFWVIAGVSAVIVIDIAISSGDDNNRAATVDMTQAPVLLRW